MTVREKPGRSWNIDGLGTWQSRLYGVTGHLNEEEAVLELISVIPAVVTFGGFPLTTVRIGIKERKRSHRVASDTLFDFDFSVRWLHKSRSKEADESEPEDSPVSGFAFNFQAPGTFFSHAISQTKFGSDAPDFGDAIGVNEDGTINGVDLQIPGSGLQIDERLIFATESQVNSWAVDTADKVGKVNQNTWRTLESGDAYLRSVTGKWVTGFAFDVTYDVAFQRGESNPSIDGISVSQRVPGFDAIWVYYEAEEDTSEKLIKPKARGVYVAQVFKKTNFSF